MISKELLVNIVHHVEKWSAKGYVIYESNLQVGVGSRTSMIYMLEYIITHNEDVQKLKIAFMHIDIIMIVMNEDDTSMHINSYYK